MYSTKAACCTYKTFVPSALSKLEDRGKATNTECIPMPSDKALQILQSPIALREYSTQLSQYLSISTWFIWIAWERWDRFCQTASSNAEHWLEEVLYKKPSGKMSMDGRVEVEVALWYSQATQKIWYRTKYLQDRCKENLQTLPREWCYKTQDKASHWCFSMVQYFWVNGHQWIMARGS